MKLRDTTQMKHLLDVFLVKLRIFFLLWGLFPDVRESDNTSRVFQMYHFKVAFH